MRKLFKLILFLLILQAFFSLRAEAENSFYAQQNSSISGLVDVYYSNNFLAVNFVQLKIWVLAKNKDSAITIVNMKDKLFYTENYEFYRGNYAQRSVMAIYDHLRTSKWKLISKDKHLNENCSVYVKFNSDPQKNLHDSLINENNKIMAGLKKRITVVPKERLNFKQIKCVVFDKYKLSKNQARVIDRVFGLNDIQYLPYSASTSFNSGRVEQSMYTIKSGIKNFDLNDLVNYSKFKLVKAELQVYDLKSNLSEQIKDFLAIP